MVYRSANKNNGVVLSKGKCRHIIGKYFLMLKFVLLLKCLPEEVVAALLRQSLKNGLDKGMENAL